VSDRADLFYKAAGVALAMAGLINPVFAAAARFDFSRRLSDYPVTCPAGTTTPS
jgi:hypothetical protein